MTATMPVTREVAGRAFPQPGIYEIDPGHSVVGFEVRHLMLSRTRGHFESFAGTLRIGDTPEESAVEVVIRPGSITTANPDRDAHLRNEDFFDAERYPEAVFRSTRVTPGTGERWTIDGDLTIKGIRRPVALDAEFIDGLVDPWGNTRIAFVARCQVNREDWDMTWNTPLAGGGVLVGKEVRLTIEVEAVRTASLDLQ